MINRDEQVSMNNANIFQFKLPEHYRIDKLEMTGPGTLLNRTYIGSNGY